VITIWKKARWQEVILWKGERARPKGDHPTIAGFFKGLNGVDPRLFACSQEEIKKRRNKGTFLQLEKRSEKS